MRVGLCSLVLRHQGEAGLRGGGWAIVSNAAPMQKRYKIGANGGRNHVLLLNGLGESVSPSYEGCRGLTL